MGMCSFKKASLRKRMREMRRPMFCSRYGGKKGVKLFTDSRDAGSGLYVPYPAFSFATFLA